MDYFFCDRNSNNPISFFNCSFLVVSHDSVSKECNRRMGEAYELNRKLNGSVSDEMLNGLRRKLEEEDHSKEVKGKRQKTITDCMSTK